MILFCFLSHISVAGTDYWTIDAFLFFSSYRGKLSWFRVCFPRACFSMCVCVYFPCVCVSITWIVACDVVRVQVLIIIIIIIRSRKQMKKKRSSHNTNKNRKPTYDWFIFTWLLNLVLVIQSFLTKWLSVWETYFLILVCHRRLLPPPLPFLWFSPLFFSYRLFLFRSSPYVCY